MEIAAQLRLLVPLTRLTGLLAITFRLAPPTRRAGARGYPLATDPVASSWLLWVSRALFGGRVGALASLKCDEHGGLRGKRMESRGRPESGQRRGEEALLRAMVQASWGLQSLQISGSN